MPVPDGPGPHRVSRQVGPWQVHLAAHQGRVRTRIEDAWCTVEGVPLGPRTVDAFAVFDGLGGAPNGQQAAWAAADRLGDAIRRAGRPERILHELNDVVMPTAGSTTATLLLVARSAEPETRRGWMLSIGDSSIYRQDGAGLARLNEHDRAERHVLTDFLGRSGIHGHLRELAVHDDDTYLLCTDGADEVAGDAAMRAVAETPSHKVPAALDRLLATVLDAGAPDNAAIMVVRRVL